MADTPRSNRPLSAAARGWCGVTALLGLFAMHGLATHGAAHASHAVENLPAVAAMGHEHGAHAMAMAVPNAQAQQPSAASDPIPDGQVWGLAGLCLAILLIGVIAATLLDRFGWLRRARDAAASLSGWPSRAVRDRDPPCLFALSIQRC